MILKTAQGTGHIIQYSQNIGKQKSTANIDTLTDMATICREPEEKIESLTLP